MDRMATNGQMIDQIDLRGVPHSGFDRSNHNYGTGKLGSLIPVRLDEVYPGDRIKGNPEMVVNFEPLAAPLMGSMVLKQESFFVPYIQLWRHAYKFFTGKNDFNEDMPTISPRTIFDIYWEQIYEPMFAIGDADSSIFGLLWETLSNFYSTVVSTPSAKYSDYSETEETFYQQYKSCLTDIEAIVRNVFGTRKMTDLVTPAFDIFRNFLDSEDLIKFSDTLENPTANTVTKHNAMFSFAGTFGQLITDFFQFFHGPSSLFDYLGWPVVPNFDSDIKLLQYGIYNRIQYCLYYALRFWSSDDANLHNLLRGYFSAIPLVFNPFKAYYLIWYWYYRDQLLETGILDPDEDEFLGSDITGNVVLYCTIMRQRCWFKDTFTTALTNTGDANLMVPTTQYIDNEVNYEYYTSDGIKLSDTTDRDSAYQSGATVMRVHYDNLEYKIPMNYLVGASDPTEVQDSDSSFISLDLFDRIKRLRSFLQKKLILGYEVDDVVYSSFLVTMSHVRMHIPEILGRGRDAVQINTIVNNTSTDQQIAGDKTATAWAHGKQSQMNYFSQEWGLFLTFTTIMPIQSYAGGMQRLYLKKDVFDYMWPDFATMGMDAVYNAELAAVGTRLTDAQATMVFGYQGRYYDLKSRLDEEHGRLLTDLNYLTFSREWDKNNPPKLNYIFVHCWPRLDGFVISSPLVDVFRYDCYNAHAWERRLPVPSEIIS